MATTNNKSKNLVDLMIETQSKTMDQVIDTTKKLTKDIPFVNETLDKGHKLYKDAVKTSTEFIDKTSVSMDEKNKQMNENSEKIKNYFEQWFENQMNWAKNTFSTNNNFSNPAFMTNPSDWMTNWQNFVNQQNAFWSNSMSTSPFAQMMNNNAYNNMYSSMNDGLNHWSQFTKQYVDMMNSSNGDWWKQFSNLTAADSFKGMNQMNESLTKFFELWIPMFKNIKEKNFTKEIFKELLSPEKYKEFVDKFFHFMPDDSRKMMEQYNQHFIQSMKQMSESGLNNYRGFKSQMNQNPMMNTNPFNQMMEMYTNWRNAMSEAVSPLSKVFEENSNVKQAKIWNDICNMMTEFNIKNNALQYMMYQHGLNVMENVAENVAEKVQKGEDIDSIVKIFQEWLMTGDEVFGKLFQSDDYSKLMTEVSSLQLRIKKEVDTQMEKMFFVNLPVATRSEMDEVYKNLYDLKKMYRNLEKMFAAEQTEEKTANKTSKKK